MEGYHDYMHRCRKLALKAKFRGENAVGALVLKNDIIVSEAEEATAGKEDITRHAEIEAVNKAVRFMGRDLSGCTLVTTHEPCIMCSYVIRYHGIKRVVYDQASEYLGGIHVLSTRDVPDHWSAAPEILKFNEK